MDKRKFLKTSLIASAGMIVGPSLVLSSCKKSSSKAEEQQAITKESSTQESPVFSLPELGYAYDAFPSIIDAKTMEIHHSKHHQGYVNKLNKALEETPVSGATLEDILSQKDLSIGVRNNGGGHYNHSLYWKILTPGGGEMSDQFKQQVLQSFESIEAFKNELSSAAATRFGSGWAWVCQDENQKLFITSTPNQDNPLMDVAEKKGHPILGIDVWEHAYYLKYQNKRGDYISNIIAHIHWGKVEEQMRS